MSNFQISGRVQYMPGPWGLDLAARNASIEIIDVDAPGKTDDLIWSGSTDDNGKFSGVTTKDWRDTETIRVWVPEPVFPPRGHWENREVPDVTDVLLLKLRIKQGNRTHEIFPFVNSAPVPVILS